MLIEGGKASLEWLAELIRSHAHGQNGRGIQLNPGRAGRVHSAPDGIYIHLLPCDHPTEASEHQAGRT